jgi:hypothetical protein
MSIVKPDPTACTSATSAMKAQWQKAIAEMAALIKTKHYSSKTLKSYSHWVW